MEATSTDKKTFQLTENGQPSGELIYENLFYLKAAIKFSNAELYQLAPAGFFGTSIAVCKNGTTIADLVMNWNGQIVISFRDGRAFALKLNGLFHNKYMLENKEREKLIQYEPTFNRRAFHYNYNITYNITNDNAAKDNYILATGRYIEFKEAEEDSQAFEAKMQQLTDTLKAQMQKTGELNKAVKNNLAKIG